MKKLIVIASLLLCHNALALDFEKGAEKDLLSKEKSSTLTAGQDLGLGFRGEFTVAENDARAQLGLGLSKKVITFWRFTVNVKGGYSVQDDFAVGGSTAKVGVSLDYKLGKNKTFVVELANQYSPLTRTFQDVEVRTGVRYTF